MAVRTPYEAADVRKILTGMITDRTVVARIASQWQPVGLFSASWANIVGTLAVDHFKKFGVPPARLMPSIFEDWAKSTVQPEQEVAAVEQFLVAIDNDHHEECADYLIDLAGKHFNKVAMERMIEAVSADLKHYEVDAADERLQKHRKINLGVGSFTEPLTDPENWISAFSHERMTPLFSYRGPLADFVGDAFQRGRLFAFMAPDKTGKTAYLIDAAYLGLRAGCRVAFFDTGDGIEAQFRQRLGQRACQMPLYPGTYKIPIGVGATWGDELEHREVELQGLDGITAFRAVRDVSRSERSLRTAFHGADSLSATDLDTILAEWDRSQDWRPDIVIVDYADILAPPSGVKDELSQIDATWKTLHRIAQQRHCLVLTATQASALAYTMSDTGLLSKKHFSGRKTKLAHVDGMLGINVTSDEKERGMARINWIVRRAAAYNERHFCRVAGSMAIQCPTMLSKRG